jgi:hypothetical protein
MAREAEHRGKPTTSVKRTVTCLRSASMAHFSCKMLDEKICRAVVVTFAVASGRSKEPGDELVPKRVRSVLELSERISHYLSSRCNSECRVNRVSPNLAVGGLLE